jgi:Domain of unknown function (DUF4253)
MGVGPGAYSASMNTADLPDGLPPGRLITPNPRQPRLTGWTGGPVCGPVYWASEEALPDAPQQWTRLHAVHDRTGLRPLLLDHTPDGDLEPCDDGRIDALDAETILLREWHRFDGFAWYRNPARRAAWRASIPEGVWIPDDPGPPFVTWPGLARPGTRGRDPDTVAREVMARNLLPYWRDDQPVHLALVPAARSADIPGRIGSNDPNSYLLAAEMSAVLRSWEDRFGARVLACLDGLYVSVASPPLDWEHGEHLALEHVLFCDDQLDNPPVWTFPSYVERILGADLSRFRWLH